MLKGIIYLLLAELVFALSSVFAKYAVQGSDLSGLQVVFFRFVFGSILAFYLLKRNNESFKPNNIKLVIYRSIFNTLSAMLFYFSLAYTTVTNTNMLSMTYPIWVVLFAPMVLHERFRKRNLFFVAVAVIGIYLVVHPNFSSINMGDITAFLSGVAAGGSIISLREARKTDSTNLIIFYLMTFALVFNGLILIPIYKNPTQLQWLYITLSAIFGLAAQFFITHGYKYIDATKGSLVSSSRIVIAMALGVVLFSDNITLQIILGAILIFGAQIGVIWAQILTMKNLMVRKMK